MPKSGFVWVKCTDCSSKQAVFRRASTTVSCQVCGATLAKPTGGKAEIKGEIVGIAE